MVSRKVLQVKRAVLNVNFRGDALVNWVCLQNYKIFHLHFHFYVDWVEYDTISPCVFTLSCSSSYIFRIDCLFIHLFIFVDLRDITKSSV